MDTAWVFVVGGDTLASHARNVVWVSDTWLWLALIALLLLGPLRSVTVNVKTEKKGD